MYVKMTVFVVQYMQSSIYVCVYVIVAVIDGSRRNKVHRASMLGSSWQVGDCKRGRIICSAVSPTCFDPASGRLVSEGSVVCCLGDISR